MQLYNIVGLNTIHYSKTIHIKRKMVGQIDMQLFLDDYFNDKMVLQRDKTYKVYGYDKAGTKITVSVESVSASAYADESGYFEVRMPPMGNGGPYELQVVGSGVITLEDIYYGDVFLLSGQSNMETSLARVGELYEKEIEMAMKKSSKQDGYGLIRQFEAFKTHAFCEDNKQVVCGRWDDVSKKSLERFSAVGFFFAKIFSHIQAGVHVGLIQTAVGGSPVEAWCNKETLELLKPQALEEHYLLENSQWVGALQKREEKAVEDWMNKLIASDSSQDTYKEEYRAFCDWKRLKIPCRYSDIKDLQGKCGIVWLKKDFVLTKADITILKAGRPLLQFGYIIDMDDIWINGIHVGRTYYQYPPRRYEIPFDVLREGINSIAIRHIVQGGSGAFLEGKPYRITSVGQDLQKNWRINLRGDWSYKLTAEASEPPMTTFFNWKPTALYYGILYPLRRIQVKGLLWYQGESNIMPIEEQDIYPKLFEGMVASIRCLFKHENLPVVSCLLAGLGASAYDGEPGGIARMRLEQMKALSIPGVDVISAADLGEFNDIHPLRKKAVGRRCGLSMEGLLANRGDSVSPRFSDYKVFEDRFVISIHCRDELLTMKKPSSLQLEWLDNDNTKHWTLLECNIDANKLIIKKPIIKGKMLKLYYGMEDFPRVSSIYGLDDMPLLPFAITL